MNKTNLLISAALAGIVTAGMAATSQAADAPAKEKCYGVAKAGKNDCAAANGSHACAGHATKDSDGNEFVLLARDECAKQGGSATPKK